MPNDGFAPNLTKLERNYEILSELHREDASRTYLARHIGLNRDVTITVVGAGLDDVALSHLASDARLLATIRHRNIIPIVEGIWLDGRTFAVVRARVRGSRLDQMIEKTGPVPIGQVATTIQSVRDAISWARENGIVHRRVTPSSVTVPARQSTRGSDARAGVARARRDS
jgi:serine/threonine-protein kinase